MLDLERKGMLRGVGTGVNALRSFKVLGLQLVKQRPSLESWGSSGGLYIHELPSHLSNESRNAQQALVMDE